MPGKPKHPTPPNLLAEYAGGDSVLELSHRYGVSRLAISRMLDDAGVERRGGSAAQLIANSRRTPERRAAIAFAAQEARRGSREADEVMRRRAKTREARGIMTARERVWHDALLEDGIITVPQFAFDRFNVDLAVPLAKVAIEVQNGWHQYRQGRARERDARKKATLERSGWLVTYVFDRQLGRTAHRELVAAIRSRS